MKVQVGDKFRKKYKGNVIDCYEVEVVDIVESLSYRTGITTYTYTIAYDDGSFITVSELENNYINSEEYLANKDAYRLNKVDEYGVYTYLDTLDVGTVFHVVNGEWYGLIVIENDVKYVYVFGTGNTHPITDTDMRVVEVRA